MKMESKSPQLSIVMPFYGKKELVGQMIDSIITNSFTDWELLAVDDGSDDATRAYLSSYTSDPRIHFIRRERNPKGATTCRNIGMDQARGEYLIFFDSDDRITPTCLQHRVRALQEHPQWDFAIFPSGIILDDVYRDEPTSTSYGYPIFRDDIAAFVRRTLPFVVCNCIYRTAALRENGLRWDEQLGSQQDSDFNIHALLSGLHYGYEPSAPDYGYRIAYSQSTLSSRIRSEAHQESVLHAFRNSYSYVHAARGTKYDADLFLGILHLYNFIFTDGINQAFALRIAQLVEQHNALHGRLLKLLISVTLLLGRFLPAKRARQVPMLPFLLWSRRQEKNKLKHIHKLIKTTPSYTQP